jgi:hypothetical protein
MKLALRKDSARFWLEGRRKIRNKGVSPIHPAQPEKGELRPSRAMPPFFLVSLLPSNESFARRASARLN